MHKRSSSVILSYTQFQSPPGLECPMGMKRSRAETKAGGTNMNKNGEENSSNVSSQ